MDVYWQFAAGIKSLLYPSCSAMGQRIGVLGAYGAGKSTLSHSLSVFLSNRAKSAVVANFDAACKHILYKPAFDIRSFYSARKIMRETLKGEQEASAEALRRAVLDLVLNSEFRKACVGKDAVLIDIPGSLDYFLLQGGRNFIAHFCDKVVYVADYNAVRSDESGVLVAALNSLQQDAYGVPVITFVNKCDVLEKRKKRELQRSLVDGLPVQSIVSSIAQEKIVRGSATEGLGLKELVAALEL